MKRISMVVKYDTLILLIKSIEMYYDCIQKRCKLEQTRHLKSVSYLTNIKGKRLLYILRRIPSLSPA